MKKYIYCGDKKESKIPPRFAPINHPRSRVIVSSANTEVKYLRLRIILTKYVLFAINSKTNTDPTKKEYI